VTITGYSSQGTFLTGLLFRGTLTWQNNWQWDPELGLILDPGISGSGQSASGDGSSNTNLAYIALVALVVVPFVVVAVIVVASVYFFFRRRRLISAVKGAQLSAEGSART